MKLVRANATTEELKRRKSEREKRRYAAKKLGITVRAVRMTKEKRLANRKVSALAWYYRNRDESLAYKVQYDRAHSAERAAYGKMHEEKNKVLRRAQKKIYRAKNKERVAAQYQANKDAVAAKCAAYYVAHADKVKENVKAWAAANPDKLRIHSINKRAWKKNGTGKLSHGIAARLMVLQKGKCPVCRTDLRKAGYHLDHIEALSKGGAHDDKNIQLLCKPCNLSKHAKPPIEFMQSRGFLL